MATSLGLETGSSRNVKALGGVQDFQSEKNKRLAELSKIGEEVGLPTWASSPKNVDLQKQEFLPQAYETILEIASFQNAEVQYEALDLLKRLFILSPVTKNTFAGLQITIKKLSELIANPEGFEIKGIKTLVAAYAAGIERFLTHLGHGHTLGIAQDVKAEFLNAIELLNKLRAKNESEPDLHLEIKYAQQGLNRLTSDKDRHPFLPTAKSLVKFGVALVTFDNTGIESAGSELVSQAIDQNASDYKKWHQPVYIIRYLGRKAVYSTDSAKQIDLLSQLVFEESQKTHMGFKTTPWQVLVSAAHMYEHIILHHPQKEPVAIYKQVLCSARNKPGLLALLSLEKSSDKSSKAHKGILQVIERLIQRLGNKKELEEHSENLVLLEDILKKETQALNKQAKKEIEELLEEQEKIRETHDPKSKENLQQIRMRIEAEQDLRDCSEQILSDLGIAIALDQEEGRHLATLKTTWSRVDVAREAAAAKNKPLLSDPYLKVLREKAAEDDYDPLQFLMTNPVKTPSGFIYQRTAIEEWLKHSETDPLTREPLLLSQLREDADTDRVKARVEEHQRTQVLNYKRSFVSKGFAAHAQLFYAVKNCEWGKIIEAIKQGAHPTSYIDADTGDTALHLAARQDPVIFQRLLFLADPESLKVKNYEQETPFSIAEIRGAGYKEILAQTSLAVESKSYGDEFFLAAKEGDVKKLEYLLNRGQPVNEKIKGKTALQCAIETKKWNAVVFLIDSGAQFASILNPPGEVILNAVGDEAEKGTIASLTTLFCSSKIRDLINYENLNKIIANTGFSKTIERSRNYPLCTRFYYLTYTFAYGLQVLSPLFVDLSAALISDVIELRKESDPMSYLISISPLSMLLYTISPYFIIPNHSTFFNKHTVSLILMPAILPTFSAPFSEVSLAVTIGAIAGLALGALATKITKIRKLTICSAIAGAVGGAALMYSRYNEMRKKPSDAFVLIAISSIFIANLAAQFFYVKINTPPTHPLIRALSNNQFEAASLLIKQGAGVNGWISLEGETALHEAVKTSNAKAVSFLLKEGASVSKKSRLEESPLELAERVGNKEILKLLTTHGKDDSEDVIEPVLPDQSDGFFSRLRRRFDRTDRSVTTYAV